MTSFDIRNIAARVAKGRAIELLEAILAKYAQRNHAWDLDREGDCFIVEASDLGRTWKDPWGRPIRMQWFKEKRDRDNDITHWIGYTTVDGQRVELVILND